MKNKGITLIALVITIIIMLILVAVTVNYGIKGGLIGKAQEAKNKTSSAFEIEQLQGFVLGKIDFVNSMLQAGNLGEIAINGVKYNVSAAKNTENEEIITLTSKEDEKTIVYDLKNDLKITGIKLKENLNEYGFYYNTVYRCADYKGVKPRDNGDLSFMIKDDGTLVVKMKQNRDYVNEGDTFTSYDLFTEQWNRIENIEYEKLYEGNGTNGMYCSVILHEDRQAETTYRLEDNIEYSDKEINIGNRLILTVKNEGEQISERENVFEIES